MNYKSIHPTSVGVATLVVTMLGATSAAVAQENNIADVKMTSETSMTQEAKSSLLNVTTSVTPAPEVQSISLAIQPDRPTADPIAAETISTEVQPIAPIAQPERLTAEFSNRSSSTNTSIAPSVSSEGNAPTAIAQQPSEDIVRQQLQERLQQLEERQQQLEEEIQLLRQELLSDENPPEDEAVPVAEAPEVEDSQGISVSAEALFLNPSSSSLQDFAIVGADRTSAFVVSGDVVGVDYDSTTALRLTATYDFPSSPVDVSVRYSTFNTEGFNSVTRPRNGVLLATLANPSQNESATSASANTELDYDVTNVELGYTLNEGDRTNIRLFGGLAFADIDQDLDVRYNGDDFNNARVNISRDFTGYGLRVGGQANFGLGGGFTLFGRAATSLLFGSFRAEQQETDENGRDLIVSLNRTLDNRVVPAIELAAGLQWEQKISNQATLNFAAGYEFQNWFNVVDSARLTDNSGQGVLSQDTSDLSINGFFIQAGLHLEF